MRATSADLRPCSPPLAHQRRSRRGLSTGKNYTRCRSRALVSRPRSCSALRSSTTCAAVARAARERQDRAKAATRELRGSVSAPCRHLLDASFLLALRLGHAAGSSGTRHCGSAREMTPLGGSFNSSCESNARSVCVPTSAAARVRCTVPPRVAQIINQLSCPPLSPPSLSRELPLHRSPASAASRPPQRAPHPPRPPLASLQPPP